MAGFHSASDYIKSSLFLLIATGVLLVISFGAPFWTTNDDGHAGLWKGCIFGSCYDRYNQWNEPWVRAAQAFMTMSLVTWVGSLVCVIAYIWVYYFYEDKRMVFLAVLCAGANAFFTFIGVIIWSACQHLGNGEILNWAYAFSWGNCIISGFATFLLVMELRTPVEIY